MLARVCYPRKMSRLRIACVLILLGLGGWASSGTAAEPRFSVEVRGDGPDVLLVPGLGSSRAVWDGLVRTLERHYRLHLVQIAGFAGEPAGPNAEGGLLEPIAAELAAYARALDRPAFVGHSMGGLLGLSLASQGASVPISRLLVVDSLPFFSVIADPGATSESVKPLARRLRDQMLGQSQEQFAQAQTTGVARLVKAEDERARIAEWSLQSDRDVFARAFYEVRITDLRPALAGIRIPTTVIYAFDPVMGAQERIDDVFLRSYAELPNVQLTRVQDALHFLMLDQPSAFSEAVTSFLAPLSE